LDTLTRLKHIFLPGIILQSVLIGGGYATGREIVEYGGKFGASGWISGLAIFAGFSIMSILTMEACRQWKVYDYKSLLKKLIGRFWFMYEIVYLLLVILTIAVMSAAAGEILHSTLGFNKWIGVIIITTVVGFLNYKGDEIIARFETIGTLALFAAYLTFSITIFLTRGDEIVTTFERWDSSIVSETPSLLILISTGVLYVGYNLGVYPASFFTYRSIETQKQSIIAGLIAGIIMTIPWFLTYFSLMGFYPDTTIINSTVPWLSMMQHLNPVYMAVFSVVVGWTLIETATGVIHGFIGRIEEERRKHNKPFKKITKAWISLSALVAAMILSQVGMIDLVAKGYTMMAYAMIAVFALPLIWFAPKLFFTKNT
jgi:uncharacterized membrane protein YkvI